MAQDEEQEAHGIEEVIVTARKREERLQDVPLSISAYSAADLEAMSLTSLRELAQFTPNLSLTTDGGDGTAAIIYIRGVGQVNTAMAWDPGVGVYMDGVYLGRMQGGNLDLGDTARIEILRGPQGTLYGRNTIGGAINMISVKPTDELEGYAEVTFGEYDRIDGRASINIPLVPGKLAARFAGVTRNRDGHGTRLDFFTGEKIDEMGDRDRRSGRALINWTPTENVDVLLSIDGSRVRDKGPIRDVVAINESAGLVGLLNLFVEPDYGDAFLTDSDFVNFATRGNRNEADVWGIGFTVDWDLGAATLKSITSYRDMKVIGALDPDGSMYSLIDQINVYWQDQFSQEFQFSGLSFEDRLNWVFGLYYFQEDGFTDQATLVYEELRDFIGLDINFARQRWINNKSYSGYGQGTYQLSDRFSLTTGLRYTNDKKRASRIRFGLFSGVILEPMDTADESWDAVSGRVGFEYQWNDDVMTYASAARGYKSGGINSRGSNELEFVPFDPEYLWTYEAGIRSDWLDRRVRFNASLYYSDYEDIQFTVIKGTGGEPITFVANAAKARVTGFEMDVVVAPAPGLNLSAAVGLTDAKYTEADPTTGVTEDSAFVKVPKWSFILAGEYGVSIEGWGELIGRVDYVYKTKIHHDAANSPRALQEGYGLLNARLTLADIDGTWAVSLFGTNLTDEHYILAGADFFPSLGFAEVQYARPREWGVSLKYNF